MTGKNKNRRRYVLIILLGGAVLGWFLWTTRSLEQRSLFVGFRLPVDTLARDQVGDTVTFSDGRRRIVLTVEQSTATLKLRSDDAPDIRGLPIKGPDGMRSLLGITPWNTLIALCDRDIHPLRIYEISLFPDSAPVKTTKAQLPANAAIRVAALSPDGKRIAWLESGHSEPVLKRLFGRYIAKFAGMSELKYCRLMVSSSNGSNVQTIGTQGGDDVSNVFWQSDGKRLCFLMNSRYYKVSAD